jgi:hypothetical protein
MGLLLVLATGHTSLLSSVGKMVAPIVLFTGFYIYFYRQQVAQNVRRAYVAEGGPLGKKAITVTADGLQEAGEHATIHHKWSGIQTVHETDSAIYLFNSPAAAYIIPKRAFQGPLSAADFLAAVAKHRGVAPA